MLGLISRTIKYRNLKSLVSLYKSLVRPQLDYCSTVWHPHFSKDKSLLEKVQHRFTRLFPHLRGLPYEERLHQLGLWSFEERWNRADLLEIFKMVKGITATPWSVFFHRAEDKITRGHSWKLVKNHCHCNTRLQFFFSAGNKSMEQLDGGRHQRIMCQQLQKPSWEKKKSPDGLF